jgi:hypothetical protein
MKTPGGEGEVINRLGILDMSKHALNSYAVDAGAGESIERLNASLAGVSDTIEKLEDSVSVASGVPPIKLYNRPSKGLSGNNDNELRLWYDDVHSIQNEKLLNPIRRICYLIQISSEGPTNGQVDPAKNYKTTAEGDAIYIDREVLEPDEVAKSRFANNPDIVLSDDHFEESLNGNED